MATILSFMLLLLSSRNFICADIDYQEDQRLPCEIRWVKYSVGSSIPNKAVRSNGVGSNNQIVSRLKGTDGEWRIGLYNSTLEDGLFSVSEEVETAPEFEIATNLFDCNVEWIAEPYDYERKDFFVSMQGKDDFSAIVGRKQHTDSEFYAGHVQFYDGQISIAFNENETVVIDSEFQVLVSYNDGLQLRLTDVILATEPFSGVDFAGHDIIQNDANVAIIQTVTHSKIYRETFIYTLSETWTSTYTKEVKGLFKNSKEETTTSHTVSNTTEIFNEREVSVSRVISVPSYTAVEACSIISVAKDFSTPYTATARYSANGMSVAAVQEILARDDITDVYTENEDVVLMTPFTGDITVSLALDTKFIVNSLGDQAGCDSIKTKLAKQKSQDFLKLKSKFV